MIKKIIIKKRQRGVKIIEVLIERYIECESELISECVRNGYVEFGDDKP